MNTLNRPTAVDEYALTSSITLIFLLIVQAFLAPSTGIIGMLICGICGTAPWALSARKKGDEDYMGLIVAGAIISVPFGLVLNWFVSAIFIPAVANAM